MIGVSRIILPHFVLSSAKLAHGSKCCPADILVGKLGMDTKSIKLQHKRQRWTGQTCTLFKAVRLALNKQTAYRHITDTSLNNRHTDIIYAQIQHTTMCPPQPNGHRRTHTDLHLSSHKPAGSWTPGRAGRQRYQGKPQNCVLKLQIYSHKKCQKQSCSFKKTKTYLTKLDRERMKTIHKHHQKNM